MDYIEVTFKITPYSVSEILIAQLENIGYESFVETEQNELQAYISCDKYNIDELQKKAIVDTDYCFFYRFCSPHNL